MIRWTVLLILILGCDAPEEPIAVEPDSRLRMIADQAPATPVIDAQAEDAAGPADARIDADGLDAIVDGGGGRTPDVDAQIVADAGEDAMAPPTACPEDMVLVPAGIFPFGRMNMGVNLPAFCIDRTEVTARAFLECAADGACDSYENWPACAEVGPRTPNQCRDDRLEYPANWVDWFRADQFCRWRGGHLPTTQEWEKAARGPDGWRYPTGDRINCDWAQYSRVDPFVDCIDHAGLSNETVPVLAYSDAPSAYGAINLAGNVKEWVDFRDDRTMEPEGRYGVSKGASYREGVDHMDAFIDNTQLGPDRTSGGHGFRCALSLSVPSP